MQRAGSLRLGRTLVCLTLLDWETPSLVTWLGTEYRLSPGAIGELLGYLREQRATTGGLPPDRTIVVERFKDVIGDVRVCILTPSEVGSTRPGRWRWRPR